MDFTILPCDNCEQLKKDYVVKFGNLKKKIISTDLLIRQFNVKKHECVTQSKKLEDALLLIEQLQRDCQKYEADLCQVLQEVEPLRENQSRLVRESDTCRQRLSDLQSQLQAAEKSREQFVVKLKLCEKEEEQLKREKADLQEQLMAMKKERAKNDSEEVTAATKSMKCTQRKYKTAMKHLVTFGDLLQSNKLLSTQLKLVLRRYVKEFNCNEENANSGSDSNSDQNIDCDSAGWLLEQRLLADDSERHEAFVPELVDVCLSPMSAAEPELTSVATQKDKEPELLDTDMLSDLAQLFIDNISLMSPLPPSPKRFRSKEHRPPINDNLNSDEKEDATVSAQGADLQRSSEEDVDVCSQPESFIETQRSLDFESKSVDGNNSSMVSNLVTEMVDLTPDASFVEEALDVCDKESSNETLVSKEMELNNEQVEMRPDRVNMLALAHDHNYANCAIVTDGSNDVEQTTKTTEEDISLFEIVDDGGFVVNSADVLYSDQQFKEVGTSTNSDDDSLFSAAVSTASVKNSRTDILDSAPSLGLICSLNTENFSISNQRELHSDDGAVPIAIKDACSTVVLAKEPMGSTLLCSSTDGNTSGTVSVEARRFTHFRVASPPCSRKPLVTFFRKGRMSELTSSHQMSHTSFVQKGYLFKKTDCAVKIVVESTSSDHSFTPAVQIWDHVDDPIEPMIRSPTAHSESRIEYGTKPESNGKCLKKSRKKSLREKVANSFKCRRGGQTVSLLSNQNNAIKKPGTARSKEVPDVAKIFAEVILSEHLKRPLSPFSCIISQPSKSTCTVSSEFERRPRLRKVRTAHRKPVQEAPSYVSEAVKEVQKANTAIADISIARSSITSLERRIKKCDVLPSNKGCMSAANDLSNTVYDFEDVQISKKRKVDECHVVEPCIKDVIEPTIASEAPVLPRLDQLPDVRSLLPNFDNTLSPHVSIIQDVVDLPDVKVAVYRIINGAPKLLKLAPDNEESYKGVALRLFSSLSAKYVIPLAKKLVCWMKFNFQNLFAKSLLALTTNGLLLRDPVMCPIEVKTYKLILYLEKMDNWGAIGDIMMEIILESVKAEQKMKVNLSAACRFYTAMCRSRNDLHRARIFCYDIMYLNFNACGPLLVGILGVWPPVLMGQEDRSHSLLHELIVFLLLKYRDRIGFTEDFDPTHVLKEVCKFSAPDCSSKQMASKLVETLKRGQQDVTFEALKGLELIAKVEGWEWTNNILIREELWPSLQSWCQKSSAELISDETVAHFIYLLGCLPKQCPVDNAVSAIEILKAMQALLSTSSSVPVAHCIQEAAVLAVLMLLPFDASMGMSVLNGWMDTTEGPSPSIRRLIERARSKYPL